MELIHYGDDSVIVNGNTYSFFDFKKLVPFYSVPYGFHTRVYRKGKEHYATNGAVTIRLPLNDAYCDSVCNREGELARLVALLEIEKKKKTIS